MKKVRWGLVSTARINSRLIPAIRASQNGELSAVASREQKNADRYAKEWGIPNAFGSYKAMLASDRVDVVYISLPNHLHKEWSVKAMQAGKHVLCEKPFALSMQEVDEMLVVSKKSGCRLAEAFMYRHHPQTKVVGDLVRKGKVGDVSVVRGVFNFKISDDYDVRKVPEFGGGALWDVGVYPMSYTQFIMGGAPKEVNGFQFIGREGVDMTFVGNLHFSGDRLGQISCSFSTPQYTSFEIIGTRGRIEINSPFISIEEHGRILFYKGDNESKGVPEEIVFPKKELYLGEVEDMNDAILEGKPNYLDLQETRSHVQTILALYKAAQTRTSVKLE